MPLPFKTREGSGVNGETLLVYDDALYEAFKSALLGNTPPLISNGQRDEAFIRREQNRARHSKKERIGNWYLAGDGGRPVIFESVGIEDGVKGGSGKAYEATVKFIPPVSRDALEQMRDCFQEELGIENDFGSIADFKTSRKNIQFVPADGKSTHSSFEAVKVQVYEDQFDKIKPHLHTQTPSLGG